MSSLKVSLMFTNLSSSDIKSHVRCCNHILIFRRHLPKFYLVVPLVKKLENITFSPETFSNSKLTPTEIRIVLRGPLSEISLDLAYFSFVWC